MYILLCLFGLFVLSCSKDSTGPNNEVPNLPLNPDPALGVTGVSINKILSWTCSDPNGDLLTYDVYFGTSSPPPLVSSDQASMSYDPGTMNYETTYYWKIVADDGQVETIGDVWTFTTYDFNGTVIDFDGNIYLTLIIGDQEWMVENLKVTHYRNGDPILNVTSFEAWAGLSTGAYCVYDNTPSNTDTYGNLYNWYAMDDPRGLAPDGWHVPTDEEIMELEMYLGMSYDDAHDVGYRGTNEGSKFAGRADLWTDGALEDDPEFGISGFDFLPGGFRYHVGEFSRLNFDGLLGSSTDYYGAFVRSRNLSYWGTGVSRLVAHYKRYGFSVRCVRD